MSMRGVNCLDFLRNSCEREPGLITAIKLLKLEGPGNAIENTGTK